MQAVHHIQIKVSELIPYVTWCINHKITFLIHGSPGLGKSWTLRRLCAELGYILRDERLSQYGPVDLRGLPDSDKERNRTVWIPPSMLPQETDPKGVLFLDEFPDAEDDVKKAAYQLVLDRRLGDYKIPDHWAVGGAGNLISDFSFVTRNPAALNNRFCHLYVIPEIRDWTQTAIAENIHPMVIGFLNWKPSWLHAFTGMERDALQTYIKNSEAWHSPRTWEWVSDVLYDMLPVERKKDETDEDYFTRQFDSSKVLIAGFVGLAATSEFSGYVKYFAKLPDLDDVLKNPHNHKCPEEIPVQYALAAALSFKITDKNIKNALRFLQKMPPEMQSAAIAGAARRDPKILDTDAFVTWSIENQSSIF